MINVKKTLGLLFAVLTLGTNVSAVDYYEYVVITSRDLIPAFDELLTWKKQKGLNAGAVAIEDILADPTFKNGDLISGINDDAGKLRAYLRASRDKGVGKYVLLGGMDEIVPIRYGYESSLSDEEKQVPSDFYFSNLQGNWKADVAGRYGANNNSIRIQNSNYILYVGRLLCRTSDDIKTWTKKQLIYEQNPGIGDFSYLGRALYTEADDIVNDNNYDGYLYDTLFKYIKVKRMKEGPGEQETSIATYPTGVQVVSEMNSVKYGFLLNANHGNTMQYALATDYENGKQNNVELKPSTNRKYQMLAMDAYDEIVDNAGNRVLGMTRIEKGNGFDNLTNYDSPSVMYSVSCLNIPFDDFRGKYSQYGIRNLGESFLCMNRGGGIAYFGHTRSGWQSDAPKLYQKFINLVETGKDCRFGMLEYNSKMQYTDHSTTLTHNLVGCPETYFWHATPQRFSGIQLNTDQKGKYWVTNVNVQGAVVCITGTKSDGTPYKEKRVISSNVMTPEFLNIPDDYVLVVTCDGYIPYIDYGIDKCVFQKVTYTGTVNKSCDYIVAGSQVTTSKPQGDVVVKSGANVTYNGIINTRLEGGFKVEKGGKLVIE